jgi:hypothetical protein
VLYRCSAESELHVGNPDAVFVVFHRSETPRTVVLPPAPKGRGWMLGIDTARDRQEPRLVSNGKVALTGAQILAFHLVDTEERA